uniref:Putative retrotransposon protein n=1 Tax=Oryza rufipogon TaxID=4529 RepID=A5YJ82_ORYRU|nr:putative retrotransposon protein [Oryza rufipogon]
MDEVGLRWTFSRANEGYTSCGPVVEMSYGGGLVPNARGSVLPACPGYPGRSRIGSVLLSKLGWVGNYVTSSVRIPWWYVARGNT